MHMQPMYSEQEFVKVNCIDIGADVFRRGLCLPSDNKMTKEEQIIVINTLKKCF